MQVQEYSHSLRFGLLAEFLGLTYCLMRLHGVQAEYKSTQLPGRRSMW